MSDPRGIERLLETVAAAATAGRPLPQALRYQGSTLAQCVATRLDDGATLPDALAAELPAHLRALLAGPRPPLAEAACYGATELRLVRTRREALFAAIIHPLLTLIATVAAFFVVQGTVGCDLRWLWLLAPGALLVVLPLLGYWTAIRQRLPWLTSWAIHDTLAGRYERASLCAAWQLPESQLVTLLGNDLTGLAPVLALPSASAHCERLAHFHRLRSTAAAQRLRWMVQLGLYVLCAAALLAGASGSYGYLTRQIDTVVEDLPTVP